MASLKSRNKLILTLKRAIEANFSASDWKELGYMTGTQEYVMGHPRLLRSLAWGDEDYGSCVFGALEHILNGDPENLELLLEYRGIEDWIRVNEPGLHGEVYGLSSQTRAVVEEASKVAKSLDVDRHVERIRRSLDDDPSMAIGSTKELLETVLKSILGLDEAELGDLDVPKLLKRVQAALDIDPKDVDVAVPGGEQLRQILGSLGQIIVAVAQLRNRYGTGHGRLNTPEMGIAEARLVVGAGTTVAIYLMELYQERKKA